MNKYERAARQGLRSICVRVRCPSCNYIGETREEGSILMENDRACPKCGSVETATTAPDKYTDVLNWIGEYAVTESHRDHISAVVLFCALTESILETLKDDYRALHPETKFELDKRIIDFKDVFGATFSDLLSNAPSPIKDFSSKWRELRDKRNKFLHGKLSSYCINQTDAYKSIDLALVAINVYVWLNNKYCLMGPDN